MYIEQTKSSIKNRHLITFCLFLVFYLGVTGSKTPADGSVTFIIVWGNIFTMWILYNAKEPH